MSVPAFIVNECADPNLARARVRVTGSAGPTPDTWSRASVKAHPSTGHCGKEGDPLHEASPLVDAVKAPLDPEGKIHEASPVKASLCDPIHGFPRS